jgi:hypothetical protein
MVPPVVGLLPSSAGVARGPSAAGFEFAVSAPLPRRDQEINPRRESRGNPPFVNEKLPRHLKKIHLKF